MKSTTLDKDELTNYRHSLCHTTLRRSHYMMTNTPSNYPYHAVCKHHSTETALLYI